MYIKMYKDPYNQAVSAKIQSKVRQHAANIDRLNGSGKQEQNYKVTGGGTCPRNYKPVKDPQTGKTYNNECEMSMAQRGGSKCCARCKNCKCGGYGMGMSGGAADTPIPAKKWFKAQDEDFKDTIAHTITPESVREERMSRDLGAGKGGRKCEQKMRGMGSASGIGTSNVTPQGLTPAPVARMRMKEDLGAGKFQGGAREDEYDSAEDDYEDGDDCGELEGGGADDEPETLREMKSICDDYEQKKLTGGAMTKRVRAMLPRGGKSMAVSLSKLLQKLKKRGRASFGRRLKMGMAVPSVGQGGGRYVGGAKDYDEISKIHDSVFGGSKLTGGYGPVAPTTEALSGYDNRDQPKGLMPPPSVNQQPSMRGGRGGSMSPEEKLAPVLAAMSRGRGASGGRPLIPVAQLPSKIGGGRFSKKGDYVGPSTGAIIPNLQSAAAPAGSGKASRGAMVAKLMKEKGMSLGEASKALKGGRYTANDFFMPRDIHQFFGAYA